MQFATFFAVIPKRPCCKVPLGKFLGCTIPGTIWKGMAKSSFVRRWKPPFFRRPGRSLNSSLVPSSAGLVKSILASKHLVGVAFLNIFCWDTYGAFGKPGSVFLWFQIRPATELLSKNRCQGRPKIGSPFLLACNVPVCFPGLANCFLKKNQAGFCSEAERASSLTAVDLRPLWAF